MNLFKNVVIVCIAILALPYHVVAAEENDVVGIWQTIDDETNKVRSLVELTINDGKLFGKIIKLFPQSGESNDPICDKCKGAKKDQPILGLQIVEGLKFNKNQWKNGEILDPNNGKTYDCKIWLEDGKLQVRGYIGFFFRTQEWIRK